MLVEPQKAAGARPPALGFFDELVFLFLAVLAKAAGYSGSQLLTQLIPSSLSLVASGRGGALLVATTESGIPGLLLLVFAEVTELLGAVKLLLKEGG